jgi:hypothetical protein
MGPSDETSPPTLPGGEPLLVLEHSVEAAVPLAFAWTRRTDVSSWSDPPATFALEGPFAPGSWGTTSMPGSEPMRWRIRAVARFRSFVIDVPLDGANLGIEWTFEALTDRHTRLTQRLSLAGPGAQAYRTTIKASFGPNLVPGMERIARELERADQEDRM